MIVSLEGKVAVVTGAARGTEVLTLEIDVASMERLAARGGSGKRIP